MGLPIHRFRLRLWREHHFVDSDPIGQRRVGIAGSPGEFTPPRPETLELALAYGIQLGRGRVFADTWDLERLEADAARRSSLKVRLENANQEQRIQGPTENPNVDLAVG